MLTIYTARISYTGDHRLDVTRAGDDPLGVAFAPSWSILRPVLEDRRTGNLIEARWLKYRDDYYAEMRVSYQARREAWDKILSRPRVVVVCFCVDVRRCHRGLLAEILVKLGAEYAGELEHRTKCRCGQPLLLQSSGLVCPIHQNELFDLAV